MTTDDTSLQALRAELALLKQEMVSLKAHLNLPEITQATVPTVLARNQPLARRRALKRMGAVLLSGAVAGAATLSFPQSAEAKLTANPSTNGMSGRVGVFITPPGAAAPTQTLLETSTYGIIVSGDTTALDFNLVPVYSYRASSNGLVAVSKAGLAVLGNSISGTGVIGNSTTGTGVVGDSLNSYGVRGGSVLGNGVYGESEYASGVSALSIRSSGVVGRSVWGIGVSGYSDISIGMSGESYDNCGVQGESNSSVGVRGISDSGNGVEAFSTSEYALYANGNNSNAGLAGYFLGKVEITGNITKGGGSFKIDHPTDPANKYLYHSFVESPDMLNIYNGTATLDANGEASITMPQWFDALNRDFRYQLTAIGAPSPNLHISQEINAGSFKIVGGIAGLKVSWQVTGIRQDAYANAHRIPVEEDKSGAERGRYLHPEVFSHPAEKGINFGRNNQSVPAAKK